MDRKEYATCLGCGSERRQVKLEVNSARRERVVRYTCGAMFRTVAVPYRDGQEVSISHAGCLSGKETELRFHVAAAQQAQKTDRNGWLP